MNKWWRPRKPSEITNVPWIHAEAVKVLAETIRPDFDVIEFGSGGSTLWFCERVRSVKSYEPDKEWLAAVAGRCCAQLVLSKTPDENRAYDLLMIDGDPVEFRKDWILKAPQIVNPGGVVVLDNANRPEYKSEAAWLRGISSDYRRVNGNEKDTQFLVTDFFWMKQ